MKQHVLVITSSGRENSNSTAMADAFVQAARDAGHNVVTLDAFALDIGACSGCEGCRRAQSTCIVEDDFGGVAREILQADTIVLAAPVYWYTFPMKMKAVIDKCVSFLWGGVDVSGKHCALMACATEYDADYVFEGIKVAFECTAVHLGWEPVGMVLQEGVRDPGDIRQTNALERCRALAEQL